MIIYRRGLEEMPARLEEIKHAKEEGVEFIMLTNPVEYIADEKGRVAQMKVQKMELGEPDERGRRSPVPIEGAIETMDVDLVVVSVGVSPNPLIPNSHPDLGVTSKGTLEATDALQTTVGDVWAGGDIVRGGATVILAMGDGRKAAASMHAKFQGK
jgi:glutamate synthase (NADPH/NADH) small chain